jgi:hypothetical protein
MVKFLTILFHSFHVILFLSYIQKFSATCSHIPSIYALPPERETKFHTHVKHHYVNSVHFRLYIFFLVRATLPKKRSSPT